MRRLWGDFNTLRELSDGSLELRTFERPSDLIAGELVELVEPADFTVIGRIVEHDGRLVALLERQTWRWFEDDPACGYELCAGDGSVLDRDRNAVALRGRALVYLDRSPRIVFVEPGQPAHTWADTDALRRWRDQKKEHSDA